MVKGYISSIWGDPSHPIVTKCGLWNLWFLFLYIINCTRFHFYCTNSFLAAEPQKLGVPTDLRGDLYNS